MSGLCAGTHECQIRSVPVLALPRLQRFSITLKRGQRTKIKILLALCQQSESSLRLLFLSRLEETSLFIIADR
ncbi:hypothetical protein DJ474_16515 [Bacillus sp. 8A6]|nr:hypothetical protein [Bacillus pumilus]NWF43088.1 hypothetical protein [Bacillus sp. 8A6]